MGIGRLLTGSLILLMLAGCGATPPGATTTSSDKVTANGLFSSFKEAAYVETSFEELDRLRREPSAADHGKKIKASGTTVTRVPEFGIGEVTVSLYDEQQSPRSVVIYGGGLFSSANKVGKKLYSGTRQQVTVYMTVNSKKGFEIDAVKNPSGKIEKL